MYCCGIITLLVFWIQCFVCFRCPLALKYKWHLNPASTQASQFIARTLIWVQVRTCTCALTTVQSTLGILSWLETGYFSISWDVVITETSTHNINSKVLKWWFILDQIHRKDTVTHKLSLDVTVFLC